MFALRYLAFFLALIGASTSSRSQDYDLLIRGGRVVDGTGSPAFFADVAITNGHVAALGRKLSGSAREEIDVKGLVVAPGFIDVHTHAEDIDELPSAENFLRMGVTTLVLGNCGGSRLDVKDYFARLEATNISPNVATLVGHGTVRNKVMGGSFMRPPTDTELDAMRDLVDRAMQDGAVGLSTGLIYLPGTFAKTEELIELARVTARYDGIYVSHMRDEGREIERALDELFRIAREAGCRAQVSHIKLSVGAHPPCIYNPLRDSRWPIPNPAAGKNRDLRIQDRCTVRPACAWWGSLVVRSRCKPIE